MCLPGLPGLMITKRKLSPTIDASGGNEIGLSSTYSPPETIIVSLTPGVSHANCAAFLILLTGFTADLPSLRSEPICAET